MDVRTYAAINEAQRDHWWYAARRTILDRVLSEVHAAGLPKGTLLDLGCGTGSNLPVLEKYGKAHGLDMSPEAVEFCRLQGIDNVTRADLDHLEGVPPESASVVLLADVIEHLDDERPCLEAARAALAPGGALIVTVPAFMFLWSPADDLAHHRRRYTAPELRQVIGSLFEIEHLTYFNTFLFGLVLAGRATEKLLKRQGDDSYAVPPTPVNQTLKAIFAAESFLVPKRKLPFGVSLLCVARKRES